MKKRALTLLEIMIVIFLITLITGTIGYSMRGSMEKGKKFQSTQAKNQLKDLLLLCLDEESNPDKILKRPGHYLTELGLAKNPDKLLHDAWGNKFEITYNREKSEFIVNSEKVKDGD